MTYRQTSAPVVLLLLAAACLATGCTTVHMDASEADYQAELERLQRELAENPRSTETMRDLGVVYMRLENPTEAYEYLQQAYSMGSVDGKTLFWLGVANEDLGRTSTAIRLYEAYPDVSDRSYRNLMQGRYDALIREMAHREMRERLADEAAIGQTDVVPEIVAVFPLTYRGGDDRYEPLGRGMAEMIMLDLQSVGDLRVVERVRLQALMSELKLAESGYVDSTSAPRMGLLLQAGRVVSGSYNIISGDGLRLDAAYVETANARINDLESREDALDNFFQVEKQIVFDLLDRFGVELTEAEIERIESVPTQNLQAFLAYCRGLRAEDEGDFEAAAEYFSQAADLDPSFSEAGARAGRSQNISIAQGPTTDFVATAMQFEAPPPAAAPDLNMLANRIGMISMGVQSGFIPGQDARKPVAEQGEDAVLPTDPLPDPPQPPGGN
ncbi:MAG: tetratricopeptide repeat protein [Rhodothermales bacterium]|nr:tetratricopeptide repeat protein [Rhodothermales bacterium]